MAETVLEIVVRTPDAATAEWVARQITALLAIAAGLVCLVLIMVAYAMV